MCWDAWAAGFIDADGSISLLRNNRNWLSARLGAYQQDRAPLDRLVTMYGSHVGFKPTANGKVMHTWHVNGQAVVPILERLLPWLVCKKERAELVLKFYTTSDIDERVELYEQVRALQVRKGVRSG